MGTDTHLRLTGVRLSIAGIVFSVTISDSTAKYINNYLVDSNKSAPVHEISSLNYLNNDNEVTALCREVAEKLPAHGCVLMHGASIKISEEGYLFCGPSGVGKSTHIALWKKYLGDRVGIINGDKTVVRIEGEEGCPADYPELPMAFGSPWAGKEGWQDNTCAPLRGICFLEQASMNEAIKLCGEDALDRLLRQVYIPRGSAAAAKTLELIDSLIESCECQLLRCTISQDAVRQSYEALTKLPFPGRA